eukprot:528501-Rhodomonas_salina.1
MQARIEQMQERIEQMQARIEQMQERIEQMQVRFEQMQVRIEQFKSEPMRNTGSDMGTDAVSDMDRQDQSGIRHSSGQNQTQTQSDPDSDTIGISLRHEHMFRHRHDRRIRDRHGQNPSQTYQHRQNETGQCSAWGTCGAAYACCSLRIASPRSVPDIA